MPTRRPFRFGTGAFGAKTREEYIALARQAEDLGYSVLLTADHFGEQLAPLTGLMAAADATRTLRVGSYVFCNDFRHPAVLAKEAATLDLLSGGRFELGLGAGDNADDYAWTGLALDPPPARVSRLAESVQILKRLFAEGPVTFSGTYYRVTGLEGYPKPLQRPSPPLFIGGSGKRMLALAAREATIVGLLMRLEGMSLDFTDGSLAATAHRIAWVRQAAGERFTSLEFNTLIFGLAITERRQTAAEHLAATYGTSSESVADSIHFLVGTVEQIVEQIQMWRERLGISYVTVMPEYMESFAPVVARLAGT